MKGYSLGLSRCSGNHPTWLQVAAIVCIRGISAEPIPNVKYWPKGREAAPTVTAVTTEDKRAMEAEEDLLVKCIVMKRLRG